MMKEIIINEKNRAKIEAMLDEVQRRCTARTIDWDDIISVINQIERRYNRELRISKKDLEESRFTADCNARTFPNAYKYVPESTHVDFVYRGGKWRLTTICRRTTNGPRGYVEANLSNAAKEAIVKNNNYIEK